MAVVQDESTTDWESLRESLLGMRTAGLLPPWVKLPFLPSALLEFVYAAQDPKADAARLGSTIEKDCGLTLSLLRHVNAASQGFRQPARTAQEALVRLGIGQAMHFLVAHGIHDVLKATRLKLVGFREFWCSNLERALFARRVARLLGCDGELAYTAAMLCDCVMPALVNRASYTYMRFLNQQDSQPTPVTAFEDEEFGWNHAEAAAYLLDAWHMPADVVCCVFMHHRGIGLLGDDRLRRTSAAAVGVAGLLPDALRQEPTGVKALRRLERMWRAFDLTRLVDEVEAEFAQVEPGIRHPLSLSRRLATAR